MKHYLGTNPQGTGQYRYGDYRYRARHPWPKRELEECIPEMEKVEDEDRISVRYAQYIRMHGCDVFACTCVLVCVHISHLRILL